MIPSAKSTPSLSAGDPAISPAADEGGDGSGWKAPNRPCPPGCRSRPSRTSLQASALALRPAQRRRAGGGVRRRRRAGQPAQGIRHGLGRDQVALRRRTGPSNRITLLRDTNGDGVPEMHTVFLDHLNSPFGVALVGNDLYVANTDAVMRYPYTDRRHRRSPRRARSSPTCRADRSTTTGPRAWSPARMAPSSMPVSAPTATSPRTASGRSWIAPPSGRSTARPAPHRLFATGLRNPNGLTFEPQTQRPVGRGQRARRTRPRPRARLHDLGEGRRLLRLALQLLRPARRPAREAATARPGRQGDPAGLCAELATSRRSAWPSTPARTCRPHYRGGAFVGEHGSWDRKRAQRLRWSTCPSRTASRAAWPRTSSPASWTATRRAAAPSASAVDNDGGLLIADDVGNTVWRVHSSRPVTAGQCGARPLTAAWTDTDLPARASSSLQQASEAKWACTRPSHPLLCQSTTTASGSSWNR